MAEWIQLTTQCIESQAEAIEDYLLELGAVSVTFQDVQDTPIFEPDLGTTPLWPNTQVIGLFESNYDLEILRQQFQQTWPNQSLQLEILPDQDWTQTWMDNYHPLKFGEHFWVVPSWLEPPNPEEPYILLDPGLAFGTGTHETTALCLDWLSEQSLNNSTLIDYGCGSGILAVAALKLGCKIAYGIDIDPQALLATQQNAQLNHLTVQTYLPEEFPSTLLCDHLIANILYGPLISLAPQLMQQVKPEGYIALSGLLQEQAEAIRQHYAPWIKWEMQFNRNDWCLLSGRRK